MLIRNEMSILLENMIVIINFEYYQIFKIYDKNCNQRIPMIPDTDLAMNVEIAGQSLVLRVRF